MACAPPKENDLTVRLEIANPRVGKVPVVLWLEYQNKPLEKAVVTVRGDMTHAGMSPVLATAQDTGKGRYILEGFGFNMAGDWVLSISAKTASQTLLGEAKLGINP